jgi:formate dehydrogenase (NADP+) beta subunit
VPKEFTHENGKLTGVVFEKVKAEYDAKGRRKLVPTGEPDQHFPATTCWSRSARRTPSPGSSATSASSSTSGACRWSTSVTMQSTHPKVFFGGDAAFGPKNIIWAVAHGHEAAISIDKLCQRRGHRRAPRRMSTLVSQKMGIHEWSYDNDISLDQRYKVPLRDKQVALRDIKAEVELGFDPSSASSEAQRCLNCDVQTVFTAIAVHRVRRLRRHLPDGLHHLHRERRGGRTAAAADGAGHNLTQDLYVADDLKTGRVMVKDEDVCLHCGLCAERCPTGAWDMQKFLLDMTSCEMTQAATACRSSSVNDFVVKFANVNGSGSASANELFARVDPAHGRAGQPAQHLPVEHPGPADLVRGARHRGRPSRRGAAASTSWSR